MYLTHGELSRIMQVIALLSDLEKLNGEDWVEFEVKAIDTNGEVVGTISREPGAGKDYAFFPNTDEDA